MGRGRELERLRDAFEQAVDERVCVLFTLLGAAGVGKSRLVAEFVEELAGEATIIRGRCLHYGDGITFWPLVEALGQLGPRAAGVLEQLAGERPSMEGELFWEVRRLLERVAGERPLVAVFDDIQWGEPTLLDLLDHVADLSRSAPILLMCLARPDLLDQRPGWAGGKLNATSVLLAPLAADVCERLVDALDPDLDTASRARIVRASQGNPLFAVELLALWRSAGDIAIPPTIHALLAARLEQLDDAEREVIECAAVEGEVFHRGGVRELCQHPLRPQLDMQLAALVRKELIRPDVATVAGDEAFRFRHLLIRDAAYESLPKRARAELHGRFADWLDRSARDLPEYDEIVGWHLEQAARYFRDLGHDPDPLLVSRAADHLAAAGRRAIARTDLHAADSLLTRALRLLPTGNRRRPALVLQLAEVLEQAGGLDRSESLLAEALADPATAPQAEVERIMTFIRVDPEAAMREAELRLPTVIEVLRSSDEHHSLARAYLARATLAWFRLQGRTADEEMAKAAEQAQRAGDRGLLAVARRERALMAVGAADRAAIREQAKALERADLGPAGVSARKYLEAFVARLDGRFDEARALLAESVEMERGLGLHIEAAGKAQLAADIELAADNPGAAVRVLRSSCQELQRLGERAYFATAAALLSQALVHAGDTREAERVAHEARAASADNDLLNVIVTDRVLAQIHGQRREHTAAERLARHAAALALDSDWDLLLADTLLTLDRVLHAAGKHDEARDAINDAIRHYERKGDVVGPRQARALAGELVDTARR